MGSDKLDLFIRKGVYPYSYMNSRQRLEETSLPPIEAFHNDLTDEEISQEDYDHAWKVWRATNCRTMQDYHDVYLQVDTLQLADILESFRDECLESYGLDPAKYYTSPGLSWDAMLKQTGIELELVKDIDQYQFIESGLRGGICYIAQRFSKANNPHVPDYDPSKPTTFISYEDINALYATSMVRSLPVGDFKWEEVDGFDLTSKDEDDERGFILEVDLKVPEELHEKFKSYPLAAESMVITDDMLSPYQLELSEELKLESQKCSKLITNLLPKKNYIIHYTTL